MSFSQQSPKMLKMASGSFIHALLLFLGLFLKISRWVPLKLLCLHSSNNRPKTLIIEMYLKVNKGPRQGKFNR